MKPRLLHTTILLTVLYLITFALNSHLGGYWNKPERDGHDRWSSGLSMHTAILWQPRLGYWAPHRSDWLGTLYSPLIQLDRHLIHPTQYISSPTFSQWLKTTTPQDWHPNIRTQATATPTP